MQPEGATRHATTDICNTFVPRCSEIRTNVPIEWRSKGFDFDTVSLRFCVNRGPFGMRRVLQPEAVTLPEFDDRATFNAAALLD